MKVIKAGSYDSLPEHLQRAVDRVKGKVNQTVKKKNPSNRSSLDQRIRNILLGKKD
ncbi:MAG TPA: hypothetical protein VIM51_05360 [Desulfosporosinus sp.]